MKAVLWLFLFCGPSLMAQKLSLSGIVTDSTSTPLTLATVMVLDPRDSSLVNFTSTAKDGHFRVKDLPRYQLELRVTYVGFETVTMVLNPDESQAEFPFQNIVMTPQVQRLDEVTIMSQRAPVTVKRDTIEFNASSFKTAANAAVEDLLKKLPGIEVDADGTVRAQGKEVERVTVDGKSFFGDDPKIATRNLPADAVDKVQVFDKKSDQAIFSGIDDGQRQKTINLSLKEEKRGASFGNAMAGAGNHGRFQAKLNANRFRKDEQFSLLGMTNNVNEQGFGIEEYMNFTGVSRQMMSGGRVRVELNNDNDSGIPLNFGGRPAGIMTSIAGGLNYNKEFTKNTELTSSYFYSDLNHDLTQELERINYFDTGETLFSQQNQQHNKSRNHQLNTVLDQVIDSMNSLKVTTRFGYNETESLLESESANTLPDGLELNKTTRRTSQAGSVATVNTNALWRHKFNKKGRTFSGNIQLSSREVRRDASLQALTSFQGDEPRVQRLDQRSDQNSLTKTWGGSLSYTEPLGGRKYVEGNYSFIETGNDVSKDVFDVGDGSAVFNEELSNEYSSRYRYHRGGMNFRINKKGLYLTAGAFWQQTVLKGDLTSLNSSISKSFGNFLPVARFTVDINETRHLEISYETTVQEPSVHELQPALDNSDPLNLYIGNPDLRPAYKHNVRMEFANFDQARMYNLFAFVEAGLTEHAITIAQEITADQVRVSQPVNVSARKQLNSDFTFGFPLNNIKSRFSLSANLNLESGINVLNDREQTILQRQVGARGRYDFTLEDRLDIGLSATVTRQSTEFEFSGSADQRYWNQTYRAESNLSFFKNYQFVSSLEYLVYKNAAMSFVQRVPLLNIALSRFFLKNNSGEFRFSVVNLLNKQIGITQASQINFIERTRSNSLGRYYSVSFTYAINKKMNPLGNRPVGRQLRIMR